MAEAGVVSAPSLVRQQGAAAVGIKPPESGGVRLLCQFPGAAGPERFVRPSGSWQLAQHPRRGLLSRTVRALQPDGASGLLSTSDAIEAGNRPDRLAGPQRRCPDPPLAHQLLALCWKQSPAPAAASEIRPFPLAIAVAPRIACARRASLPEAKEQRR